ncbi:hypothetical protein DM02DRAFT_588545 [Periconia macrospinosa]|uniref:tRNA (guanine(9)-N1)-methyltransferase n=1 Tax=Periconia macrospinosa TaxID=97972 RepID=A0A2V1DYC7_9PLEO|nr:hypothetical protein DM02DRAFT_588545 [Periconia macrospinosa]
MRKIDHAADDGDAHIADAAASHSESTAQATTTSVTGQEAPAASENGEEIILTGIPVTKDDQTPTGEEPPKLSKNQLKKQRRLQEWEAGREDRKVKRKEKIKEKKERRRQEWAESRAKGEEPQIPRSARSTDGSGAQVPITVIFDCDFEDLMFDNELKSLGLQLTRCYSDNRRAPYRFHYAVSSFGGKLKERFDGILAKQYLNWKGVHFCEEDFVKVSEMAKEWMGGPRGGSLAGALKRDGDATASANGNDEEEEGEVVYLSSESDVTLERLKPNSTYIIGGLVDKNRHKGICYKRAVERGIKTAKLPISEFLQMKSRQVLVTNHVLDIMLKWVQFNDWGKAFMEVMPKRKGGVLKDAEDHDEEKDEGKDAEDEGGDEEMGKDKPAVEDVATVAGPSEAT